jgi:uncharacterized damage-inducible protein DinB
VWFLDGVINQQFGAPNPSGATTIAQLVSWYKEHMPNRLERVLAMDGAKLATIVDFFGMKMPNAQVLVFEAVHNAHHRGQLTTYLRPMGRRCPISAAARTSPGRVTIAAGGDRIGRAGTGRD